jgi:hypothetical protein
MIGKRKYLRVEPSQENPLLRGVARSDRGLAAPGWVRFPFQKHPGLGCRCPWGCEKIESEQSYAIMVRNPRPKTCTEHAFLEFLHFGCRQDARTTTGSNDSLACGAGF